MVAARDGTRARSVRSRKHNTTALQARGSATFTNNIGDTFLIHERFLKDISRREPVPPRIGYMIDLEWKGGAVRISEGGSDSPFRGRVGLRY